MTKKYDILRVNRMRDHLINEIEQKFRETPDMHSMEILIALTTIIGEMMKNEDREAAKQLVNDTLEAFFSGLDT